MAFEVRDQKTYCGRYKGVDVWGIGCVIGNNWYGDYYCTKEKNGRNYKVKDSVSSTIEGIKSYIDEHLNELKKVIISA